ncbi:MCP four helix bundle domain-containing protein [Oxalobacteraceae bacterium]|nr:MCP four helix bundle domain-containing protein [Oxalobacteraceae bacterium]
MNISRFKVSTLLMTGYATVCVFLAAAIALGLSEQAKLNAITASVAGERWPRIELASHVRLRVTDISVALRNVMLTYDSGEQDQQLADIVRFRKEIAADTVELERRVLNPSGRAVLAQVNAAVKAYENGQRQLIALVQARQDVEARAYLNDELMPMLQACRDAMAKQIGNEVALMNEAREQAAEAYAATRFKMLALGALGLLGSGALAALITTRLRRSLGGEPAQAARVAARIAEGDLTGAVVLRDGDSSSLMYEMERMRAHLGLLVGQVRQDSEQIAAASTQIAAGNLDLSARTVQQAASLEETASAMQQLSAAVERNSANAEQADSLVRQAAVAAERGGETVAAVTVRMHAIADSARRVAEIVGLIDGIAFQTNILALNAAVEAARAGDAGRGFAVVAAEVRQLAQRSAAASHQIGQLISTATGQANAGAEMVEESGRAMRDIIDSIARVETILVQIRDASADQHSGIVACSRAVVEIDRGTQQNASLVDQVAVAAQSLQDQSGRLTRAVSRFHIPAVRTEGEFSAGPAVLLTPGRSTLARPGALSAVDGRRRSDLVRSSSRTG